MYGRPCVFATGVVGAIPRMANVKRPPTEPFDPDSYVWPADELARFKDYMGEAGFAAVVAAEKRNRANAHAAPAGLGHNNPPHTDDALAGAGPTAMAAAAPTLTVFEQFEAIVDSAAFTAEQKCILVKMRCRVNSKTMDNAIVSKEGLMRAASLKSPVALRGELRDLQGKPRDIPKDAERDQWGRPIKDRDPVTDKDRATIVMEERRGKAYTIGFTPERLQAIYVAYEQYRERKRGPGRPWPSKPPASGTPPLPNNPPASHAPPLSGNPPTSGAGGLNKPPASHAENPLRPTHPDPFPLSGKKNSGADAPPHHDDEWPLDVGQGGAKKREPPAAALHAPPKRGRKPAACRTQIPADWMPDAELIAWVRDRWAANDRQIGKEAEKFRAHHTGKGSLMVDWVAAWRTWWLSGFHRIPERPQATSTTDTPNTKAAELEEQLARRRREEQGQ
jgi:hypothetical protein